MVTPPVAALSRVVVSLALSPRVSELYNDRLTHWQYWPYDVCSDVYLMAMSKIRKQVYINPDQETQLKILSQRSGESEAELIRQAIALHLNTTQAAVIPGMDFSLSAWSNEVEFIAALKNRHISGKRDWSRADLYDS